MARVGRSGSRTINKIYTRYKEDGWQYPQFAR